MPYSSDQLKGKLRELKKLELRIRFKDQTPLVTQKLVWDVFFSTKVDETAVKYPLPSLLKLSREVRIAANLHCRRQQHIVDCNFYGVGYIYHWQCLSY